METKKFPASNVSREVRPWGRELEDRIRALEEAAGRTRQANDNANKTQDSSMELIARQIVQLNNASETKDAYLYLAPATTPDSQGDRTDYDVVTATFTKPSWATRATVFVTATIEASGTVNSPSSFTAIYARVDGVNSRDFVSSLAAAPLESPVYSGGVATGDRAYAIYSKVAATVPFTRTLTVAGDTLDCSVRISKPSTGAGATYSAAIGATVFWFAT